MKFSTSLHDSAREARLAKCREYYRQNRERLLAMGREAYARRVAEDPEAWRAVYRDRSQRYRNANPEQAAESSRLAVRRAASAHPDRPRARRLLFQAVRRGDVVRPDACDRCHRECQPEAHHSDYTKPYNVAWLCRDCHGLTHRRVDRQRAMREARSDSSPARPVPTPSSVGAGRFSL